MINRDELIYKIEAVIEYLKNNGGYEYNIYNYSCPDVSEPDSNIVEYAEDVKQIIEEPLDEKDNNNNNAKFYI